MKTVINWGSQVYPRGVRHACGQINGFVFSECTCSCEIEHTDGHLGLKFCTVAYDISWFRAEALLAIGELQ